MVERRLPFQFFMPWLINVAVTNAWMVHRGSKALSQLEFKREIAVYYCRHYGTLPIVTGPKRQRREDDTARNVRYDGKDHFVTSCQRRRCAGERCNSTIRTMCKKCNVGLCIVCFADYHTRPGTPSSHAGTPIPWILQYFSTKNNFFSLSIWRKIPLLPICIRFSNRNSSYFRDFLVRNYFSVIKNKQIYISHIFLFINIWFFYAK